MFIILGLLLPGMAVAHTGDELTGLQVWAGYLSWLGFFKVLGAVLLASGFIMVFHSVLRQVLYSSRVLLELLGYVASIGLIASGFWVTDPEYLSWTVFVGCLLFGGTVFASLWIHKIKRDDPKLLATFFMVVWGAVAVYYNMTEVGFLSVFALMTVLGFSFMVTPLCYAFGFGKDSEIATATATSLYMLGVFLVIHIGLPDAPDFITVFMPGAFWAGSFVAYLGLLILALDAWSGKRNYLLMQIIAVALMLLGVMLGMMFGINPLAGTAGVFLVLYLITKPFDWGADLGIGIRLIASGSIAFGAWYLAQQNLDIVQKYLTTQL